jgi:hypothetical protein
MFKNTMKSITKAVYSFFLLTTLVSYSQDKTKTGGVGVLTTAEDSKPMEKPNIYDYDLIDIDGKYLL